MTLDIRVLDLIATVIGHCEEADEPRPGHPPAATVRVLATLRRFGREGTPWRSLRATPTQASGSTLRRRLAAWADVNLLQRVHALLVAMLRGDPDLILDSCSVRAKRGGDLVGPNPTDRGKRGTKYHVAVTGDGVPVACLPRQPISMTRLSSSGCSWPPSQSWPAFARYSPTKATTLSTIAIYVAPLLPSPASTSTVSRADRDWASDAGRSSAATPGCWRTNAWRCGMTASASSYSPCSRPPVSSWLQDASPENCDNRL